MNVNAEQMQLNHEPILSLRNLVDKKAGNRKNSSLLLLIFIPFFKTDVTKEGLVFQIAIFYTKKLVEGIFRLIEKNSYLK